MPLDPTPAAVRPQRGRWASTPAATARICRLSVGSPGRCGPAGSHQQPNHEWYESGIVAVSFVGSHLKTAGEAARGSVPHEPSEDGKRLIEPAAQSPSGAPVATSRPGGSLYSPLPGSAIRRCCSAFSASGVTLLAASIVLVFSDPATTLRSPSMRASKPCLATLTGSSLEPCPTRVSSMSALWKKLVSVGPGMSEVITTSVSLSSFCTASANDCRKDFDAL